VIIIIREYAYDLKEQRKKKNRQKPIKAPLWHKPFSPLIRQSAHVRQNSFGQWCADGQNRFYGKTGSKSKTGRFYPQSP